MVIFQILIALCYRLVDIKACSVQLTQYFIKEKTIRKIRAPMPIRYMILILLFLFVVCIHIVLFALFLCPCLCPCPRPLPLDRRRRQFHSTFYHLSDGCLIIIFTYCFELNQYCFVAIVGRCDVRDAWCCAIIERACASYRCNIDWRPICHKKTKTKH